MSKSKRMLALQLGFACAALANFPALLKEKGLREALRKTSEELGGAFKPL